MDDKKITELKIDELLKKDGPVCLIIEAHMRPASGEDRFQPAGFPQIGHVIYDAPRGDNGIEKVCIVDSAASMANHLETVCLFNPHDVALQPELNGLPHIVCTTDKEFVSDEKDITLKKDDKHDRAVTSTLREGHRIASDYFLDGLIEPKWNENTSSKKGDGKGKKKAANQSRYWRGENFRSILRNKFQLAEIKRNEKYYSYPDSWPAILTTIFEYDPNSLIHGVLFAKEQIKINRMLTAHMEAFGAKRINSTGVKFDPLGKTTSGQPIFSVDEETAKDIRAVFVIDLALLRSYGRDNKVGLMESQKQLLLELALWKIYRLLEQPFAFRSNCRLQCKTKSVRTEETSYGNIMPKIDIRKALDECGFSEETNRITKVYYPADVLFKVGTGDESETKNSNESEVEEAEG
jgi:CRISPR-associated protein Csb1